MTSLATWPFSINDHLRHMITSHIKWIVSSSTINNPRQVTIIINSLASPSVHHVNCPSPLKDHPLQTTVSVKWPKQVKWLSSSHNHHHKMTILVELPPQLNDQPLQTTISVKWPLHLKDHYLKWSPNSNDYPSQMTKTGQMNKTVKWIKQSNDENRSNDQNRSNDHIQVKWLK